MSADGTPTPDPTAPVSFDQAVRVWLRVGLLSFGGPSGQIAVMHRILVEEKRWIDEARFLHALSFCMLLPGPEAMQLATYVGWLLHRIRGGLVAGMLFVLPGFVSILALSVLYAGYHHVPVVSGAFHGLKPALATLDVAALAIAAGAWLLLARTRLGEPAVLALAAGAGLALAAGG